MGGSRTITDRHFCLDRDHDKQYFSVDKCTDSLTENCGENRVCEKSFGCFDDIQDVINGVSPLPYDVCGQLKCVQKCACPTVPNTPQWTRISCPAELPGQPKTDYPCL